MRAQHKGLIFSLSLKRFSPLDTEVVEIFAARTDCFTKKTLILFKGQKCSFVLKMDRSQGLNTNLGNKNAFKTYILMYESLTQFCLNIASLYFLLNYELFLGSDVF